MPTTTNPPPTLGNAFLARAYGAKSPSESRAAYDDWASTYDADMIEQGYIAPKLCAEYIVKHSNTKAAAADLRVLDAGCGSGGVGRELASLGVKIIDGADYSSGMLDVARKTGVYRNLMTVDLFKPIEGVGDGEYDAVVCVGTLTEGHVGPDPALKEFVRVVGKGGVVVATILESIWEKGGFGEVVSGLVGEGKVEIVSKTVENYRQKSGAYGIVLVLRKV